MNPEWYEPLMEKLFEVGALDVTLTPVIMKKNRPGVIVGVLTTPKKKDRLLEILFQESTTLGARTYPVERFELKRESKDVNTIYGKVSVKVGLDAAGRILNTAPEFESCKLLAKKKGVPLKKVYAAAIRACK